jgi:hypothetical protein
LTAAQNSVILADRACRSQEGMKLMVALTETLTALVVDIGGRMNFSTTLSLPQPDKRSLLVLRHAAKHCPALVLNTVLSPHFGAMAPVTLTSLAPDLLAAAFQSGFATCGVKPRGRLDLSLRRHV